MYALYFDHFNSYPVPSPNLEQINRIITPPNLGQIFLEPRFMWMILSVRGRQVYQIAQVVYNDKSQVSNSQGTCVIWQAISVNRCLV